MATTKRPQPLAKPRLITRLRSYGRDHLRGMVFSLGKLYRQPFATTLTLLMIAVALALPACLYLLLNNLQAITQQWDDAGQITLFMSTDTSEDAIKLLRNRMQDHSAIESVKYVSANEAMKEFEERSEFGHLLDGLDDNPLPPILIITPIASAKQTENLNELVSEFQNLSNVDYVQLDIEWLHRLQAITDIIRRIVTLIGIMLAVSVFLVVGNSIRLDIENRREEIEVTKLIGATDRFIRRPFLYGGMWYGLLGGLIALFLVVTVLIIIKQPAQNLVRLYDSNFQFMLPSFKQCVSLVATSICLGLIGSWLAVGRHISKIEPS